MRKTRLSNNNIATPTRRRDCEVPVHFRTVKKKGKSAIRFANYKGARTIQSARRRGATAQDIRHDFNHGFCTFVKTIAQREVFCSHPDTRIALPPSSAVEKDTAMSVAQQSMPGGASRSRSLESVRMLASVFERLLYFFAQDPAPQAHNGKALQAWFEDCGRWKAAKWLCAHLFDAPSMTPTVSARGGPWIETFFKQDVATAALCILYNAEQYRASDVWCTADVREFARLVLSLALPVAKGSLPACWHNLEVGQGVPEALLELLRAGNAQLYMIVGTSEAIVFFAVGGGHA